MRSVTIPTALALATFTIATALAQDADESGAGAPPARVTVDLPPDAGTAKERLAASPRHGEWVDVERTDGPAIKSFVVYPERSTKAPVVIVIHEIFGLTDWVRGVADQLAKDGFIAIAPDLLSGRGPGGGGTDALGDRVTEEIRRLTVEDVVARLDGVRDHAMRIPASNGKIASIGFCWGGGMSVAYALRQPALDAAVSYYGPLPTEPAAYANARVPILGLYGGNDARVNTTIPPAKAALKEAGAPYEPIVYEGAGHGFLRQQDGADGANASAARRAWSKTLTYLNEHTS